MRRILILKWNKINKILPIFTSNLNLFRCKKSESSDLEIEINSQCYYKIWNRTHYQKNYSVQYEHFNNIHF